MSMAKSLTAAKHAICHCRSCSITAAKHDIGRGRRRSHSVAEALRNELGYRSESGDFHNQVFRRSHPGAEVFRNNKQCSFGFDAEFFRRSHPGAEVFCHNKQCSFGFNAEFFRRSHPVAESQRYEGTRPSHAAFCRTKSVGKTSFVFFRVKRRLISDS